MKNITLYHNGPSTCSQKVRIILELKKIKSFLNSEYDMLRGASVWALKQLLTSNDFENLKKKHLNNEKSIEVKTEWR